MVRSTITGACELCAERAPQAEMRRHVQRCAQAHYADSEQGSLILLAFTAPDAPDYWILVEASADASLEKIDAFLRHIWLECCGHMSAFYLGREELRMVSKVGDVIRGKGTRFRHEYDFGSTTVLQGQVLGAREGSIGRRAVRLLARNDPLPWTCTKCEKPATTVCPFCSDSVVLCDAHARTHPHANEDAYLPIVNSPRMGVCGYTG
jgi:hypothetical protein